VSFPTVLGRAVEGTPFREAQVDLGPAFANSYYLFSLSGGNTLTNVYQNGTLTTAFPSAGTVFSDAYGRFPAIYLDPSIIYRVRLFNSAGTQLRQTDPYYSQLSTVGTSALSAYGFQIATTGEVTLDAPNTGGSGVTLTLNAGALGTAALQVTGTLAGNSAIIVNSSATTGAQTATFTATNKPGTATSSPAGWLPITCDSVQYYVPIWHGNNFTPYAPNPTALGQVIVASSIAFEGNGTSIATGGTVTPSNWFSPATPNIGSGYYVNFTKTSGLSGLAFTIGGTPISGFQHIGSTGITVSSNAQATIAGTYQLSTSASGSPIVATGTISLSNNNGVQSPTYSGATPFAVGGNGQTNYNGTGGPAWYLPVTANIGSGYYILITQTGGTSGYSFSAATGTPANITNSGISIGISGSGSSTYYVTGTYIISSDSAGANVLGSGTITLTGGFTPVTHIYTSGTNATETVPTGATHVYIELLGSGGSGNSTASNSTSGADGGGGGLAVLSSIAVTGGQTLTYTIGAGGAGVFNNSYGNPGANSSVTGTVTGGSVSLAVTGAGSGKYGSGIQYGGSGGVATGGSTNTNGNTGGIGSGASGGNGLSGTYVTGGTGGLSNNTAGQNGGNGGNYGAGSGAATNNGTTGTSGTASGGQVAFHYT
jgi:hypothetical protein